MGFWGEHAGQEEVAVAGERRVELGGRAHVGLRIGFVGGVVGGVPPVGGWLLLPPPLLPPQPASTRITARRLTVEFLRLISIFVIFVLAIVALSIQ